MRILIIEDEKTLAQSIAEYLKREGYRCGLALNWEEAIEKIMLYDYHCILLDINLPDGNGLDVLERSLGGSKENY